MKNEMSKKYGVIYADPPWRYGDKRSGSLGGAENHYPTMSIDEICALNIENLLCDDALLFLWVTFPTLTDAMRVFPAWGFEYKTLGFAWIKTNKRQNLEQKSFLPVDSIDDFFGIGSYTKSNCEVCLIGVRGNGRSLVVSDSVPSTIVATRMRHSKKPDEARNRIVDLVGEEVPKLEMFAREAAPGWDVWGNEVECSLALS